MQGPTEAQMKGQFLDWLDSNDGECASCHHSGSSLMVHASVTTPSLYIGLDGSPYLARQKLRQMITFAYWESQRLSRQFACVTQCRRPHSDAYAVQGKQPVQAATPPD